MLAVLLPAAMRPAPAWAQGQSNQDSPNQDSQPQQMAAPAPGGMSESTSGSMSGATSGSAPGGSTTEGRSPRRIDLPQPPLLTMTAVPGYGPAPLSVGFFVNTVDPEGKGFVSYVWNFGDGQVSMDPPLTFFHTYKTAGTYVATVSATTADGRTAIAYAGITVRPSVAN